MQVFATKKFSLGINYNGKQFRFKQMLKDQYLVEIIWVKWQKALEEIANQNTFGCGNSGLNCIIRKSYDGIMEEINRAVC